VIIPAPGFPFGAHPPDQAARAHAHQHGTPFHPRKPRTGVTGRDGTLASCWKSPGPGGLLRTCREGPRHPGADYGSERWGSSPCERAGGAGRGVAGLRRAERRAVRRGTSVTTCDQRCRQTAWWAPARVGGHQHRRSGQHLTGDPNERCRDDTAKRPLKATLAPYSVARQTTRTGRRRARCTGPEFPAWWSVAAVSAERRRISPRTPVRQ
jgi:hypothetical protein